MNLQALTTAKQKKESGGLLSFLGSMNFSSQSEPDHWFDAKKNYINSLETQLSNLARTAGNIIRKKKGRPLDPSIDNVRTISSLQGIWPHVVIACQQ